jgi:rSAM/selenodomain-associated transferase 2
MQKPPSTPAILAQRLLGLGVSVLILWLVLRRLDTGKLASVLQRSHFGWLLIAFVFYAGATIFGALRWHGMLRATKSVVHVGATFRFAFIGSFFNALLLGPAGGDLVKTGLYARWFKQPLPHVIAASFLDRVLGLGGSVLLALVGIALALFADGGEQLRRFNLHWPEWPWLLGGALSAGAIAWWWKQRRRESFLGRTATSLEDAFRHFRSAPLAACLGLFYAFILQACFCCVLACCLQAVASEPIPWLKMAWTFPAIGFAATMPVTVAGAGVREGASVFLFGLYGVQAPEAFAASLLTLLVYVVWALIGGALFARERAVMNKVSTVQPPASISIVIPVLNEAASLPATLAALPKEHGEVIIVDGRSQDQTVAVAQQLGCRVITSERGRGKQLRAGAEAATGDVILFLHADTLLDESAITAVKLCLQDPSVVGGACWKRFRDPHWLMRGSRWRCWTRLHFFRRVLGDQAIFVRKEALAAIGGFPALPLMEEFELCRRLRKIGRLALAPTTVSTSARRFHERGILRTYWLMWRVTFLYHLGTKPEDLRQLYERR